MALTQLSDVIVPEIVAPEAALMIPEKSALIGSAAVANDAKITELASGNAGQVFNVGRYNHIADAESNASSDAATTATPQKNTMADIFALKHTRNQGWQHADLVNALSQPDPQQVVSEQLGEFWGKDIDKTGIASLVGVKADNVANNSGDMVYSVATDDAAAVTDAEKISGEAVIRSLATLGDNMNDIAIIIMHSTVYTQLLIKEEIAFIPPSEGKSAIPIYLGKEVIVSDLMPATAGTNRTTFTTALLGANALRYGEGMPANPLAIDRTEAAGNGEGIETLWSRHHHVITPTNYSWDYANATVAGKTPTNAEVGVAGAWTRTVDRKDVKITFLDTNG